MSSTCLSMDLTHWRVSPTLRVAATSRNLLPWIVQPSGRSSTFITGMTGCLVFCCFSSCIYVFVCSCIFLLFFVGFIFLFCLGYSLHLVLGLIFVVETSAPFGSLQRLSCNYYFIVVVVLPVLDSL
jgi:hypothetical protein